MFEIKCPWCGPRAEKEFTYVGDATVNRPDPDAASTDKWLDHIYLRDNAKGWHDETWHHTAGCRRMLKARRDTTTHEIASTAEPGGDLTGGGE